MADAAPADLPGGWEMVAASDEETEIELSDDEQETAAIEDPEPAAIETHSCDHPEHDSQLVLDYGDEFSHPEAAPGCMRGKSTIFDEPEIPDSQFPFDFEEENDDGQQDFTMMQQDFVDMHLDESQAESDMFTAEDKKLPYIPPTQDKLNTCEKGIVEEVKPTTLNKGIVEDACSVTEEKIEDMKKKILQLQKEQLTLFFG